MRKLDFRASTKIGVIAAMAIALSAAQLMAQANQPATKPPPQRNVRSLAFSPDGKSLAVVYTGDNSLKVWDLAAQKPKFVLQDKGGVGAARYSPAGDLLAVAVGRVIQLLDPETGNKLRELQGHPEKVRGLAFTADGKQLASGGKDRAVKLWDLTTDAVLQTFTDEHIAASGILNVAISPDGKWLAETSGSGDLVRMWPVDGKGEPSRALDGERVYAMQLLFSPDSRFLAVPHWNGSVWIIDAASGKEAFRFTNAASLNAARFSTDGRRLAIAGGKTIELLSFARTPTDVERREIAGLIEQFNNDDYAQREAATRRLTELGAAAETQLREQLNSDSPEMRVRCRRLVQRLHNVQMTTDLFRGDSEFNDVEISPDGKTLAGGDRLGIVTLWNIADRKEIASLQPVD